MLPRSESEGAASDRPARFLFYMTVGARLSRDAGTRFAERPHHPSASMEEIGQPFEIPERVHHHPLRQDIVKPPLIGVAFPVADKRDVSGLAQMALVIGKGMARIGKDRRVGRGGVWQGRGREEGTADPGKPGPGSISASYARSDRTRVPRFRPSVTIPSAARAARAPIPADITTAAPAPQGRLRLRNRAGAR
ncbi:hypothetical protein [Sphingobium sp. 15-1]|uniref:hypothetical protein n=1 Tax=Sphingobium sp. 15-1 TaxID=2729616 RepID=UPI00159C452D|nr:hypothetical protein [Sphingobium sp. 15-1]